MSVGIVISIGFSQGVALVLLTSQAYVASLCYVITQLICPCFFICAYALKPTPSPKKKVCMGKRRYYMINFCMLLICQAHHSVSVDNAIWYWPMCIVLKTGRVLYWANVGEYCPIYMGSHRPVPAHTGCLWHLLPQQWPAQVL